MGGFHLYIGNKCFSSWSLRPWIALRHFEIPFEETVIRLRTPATAANLAGFRRPVGCLCWCMARP